MRLGLFGGTFDPVHNGHLQLARRAAQEFELDEVLFIPAFIPPHKKSQPLAAFEHRYAMLALATRGQPLLVPSLLEAPRYIRNRKAEDRGTAGRVRRTGDSREFAPSYSIETVRRVKRTLQKGDRLFFLIGIDAFLEIASWKDAAALLRECEFIVGSRPGYTLADVANALPTKFVQGTAPTIRPRTSGRGGDFVAGGAHIHLLHSVHVPVSATQIRRAAGHRAALTRLVPLPVAEYISKMGLYGKDSGIQEPAPPVQLPTSK
jgi:nicotinate-nucleotide adenylyltransferase